MKMNPVVHFEMPYENRERMAKFYTEAFGWKAQMLGEEMGNYVSVATAEMGEDNMPKVLGTIGGGFYEKSDDKPAQYPSVVIAVEDINEAIENIKKLGGSVLGEPWDISGVGKYISFIDTEGNRVSILQPSRVN
jgi:predicted enzyme related to lactoylglutathione lyase